MIRLIDILKYTRKHGGATEALFINNYLIPKLNELGVVPEMDAIGNIWASTAHKEHAPFLFVAHIDTCHQREGIIRPKFDGGFLSLDKADVMHGCLGADDGVGIYCNLKMIEAGVLGTYLFTRGEEKGGIGATYIAHNEPHRLEGFLMSIEVDRAGTDEIIIEQAGGKCASSQFAKALADQIGMNHRPSYEGVYTDVAEFTSIIPENVNISAGYYSQHTYRERVDVNYVNKIVDKLINVDYNKLPICRDVADSGANDRYGWWDRPMVGDSLLEYVEDNPDRVAYFLEQMGVDIYEIESMYELDDSDEDMLAVGMQ